MKKLIAAAALSLTALVYCAGFARADDMEDYKARWTFYNADHREVVRFAKMGFTADEFKAIANIALRTGLTTDYVARQVLDVGMPLPFVASWNGVPTTALNADIPGFNSSVNTMAIEARTASTTMPVSTVTSASLPQGNVLDVVMNDPQFSTLASAIKAAGLVDTLKGSGPFTIFAPTNDAFAKLPAGTLDEWLKPENKDKLVALLTYHVVPGKLKAADVMGMTNPSTATTLSGKTLNVKTSAPVMIGNANITKADIEASNGVVHAIDTVLTPDTDTVAPAPTVPETPATPAPPETPTTPTPAPPSTP